MSDHNYDTNQETQQIQVPDEPPSHGVNSCYKERCMNITSRASVDDVLNEYEAKLDQTQKKLNNRNLIINCLQDRCEKMEVYYRHHLENINDIKANYVAVLNELETLKKQQYETTVDVSHGNVPSHQFEQLWHENENIQIKLESMSGVLREHVKCMEDNVHMIAKKDSHNNMIVQSNFEKQLNEMKLLSIQLVENTKLILMLREYLSSIFTELMRKNEKQELEYERRESTPGDKASKKMILDQNITDKSTNTESVSLNTFSKTSCGIQTERVSKENMKKLCNCSNVEMGKGQPESEEVPKKVSIGDENVESIPEAAPPEEINEETPNIPEDIIEEIKEEKEPSETENPIDDPPPTEEETAENQAPCPSNEQVKESNETNGNFIHCKDWKPNEPETTSNEKCQCGSQQNKIPYSDFDVYLNTLLTKIDNSINTIEEMKRNVEFICEHLNKEVEKKIISCSGTAVDEKESQSPRLSEERRSGSIKDRSNSVEENTPRSPRLSEERTSGPIKCRSNSTEEKLRSPRLSEERKSGSIKRYSAEEEKITQSPRLSEEKKTGCQCGKKYKRRDSSSSSGSNRNRSCSKEKTQGMEDSPNN